MFVTWFVVSRWGVDCTSVMLGTMLVIVRLATGAALMRLYAIADLLSWIHLCLVVQSCAATTLACGLRHSVVIPGAHTHATVIEVETTSYQRTKRKRIPGLGVHPVRS